jgi:uncharacterized membrane protein YhaH (DUF805 family)
MTFSQAINTCFQKYAVFSGRAKRSEYWWWFLFSALAGIPFSLLDSFSENVLFTLISLAISIALFIPGLAVLFRRLHDTNRSGWWWLIILVPCAGVIVLLVFLIQDSDPGTNSYGN